VRETHVRTCGGMRVLAVFLLYAASAFSASAQTYRVLHNFNGTDGNQPYGPLVQGFDGEFYGTTMIGGANSLGTFFKIRCNGVMTVLHHFMESPATDAHPGLTLIEGPYGNFYGTTLMFGGEVYRMTPDGAETILFIDEEYPNSLIWDWNYDLRGVDQIGGVADSAGDVFNLTTKGKEATVHTFCHRANCSDGQLPQAMIQASDGNFYGVTYAGGVIDSHGYTNGTIFAMGPTKPFTILYNFCAQANCADGGLPSGLMQSFDGNLYGTTDEGGANGVGTIFKITTTGVLTTLYSFCSLPNCADGLKPFGPLIQGSDRNLYGVNASGGGANGAGTIFRITADGVFTVLHTFDGADGNFPVGLVQGTDGAFYGATENGGARNFGVVFRLDVGLGRFVQPVLTFGKVGDRVTLLGNNLAGATAISFNGVSATIEKITKTWIATAVPVGATSGPITVTTPSGTLSGNVSFTVLP